MNYMKIKPKDSFFIGILMMLSFFTSFAILDVNAVEDISVSAKGFENTIIIEFKNGEQNTAKIKTVNVWLASGDSFKSFKTEFAWNGKTYGDGQGLTFSTSEMLNPGESAKFGAITGKKVSTINWKAIDENGNEIGPEKVDIVEISQTPIIIDSGTTEVEVIQENKEELYGTKKFIPENIRTGSNVRLAGDGFSPNQTHQFYLNDDFLKSVKSDSQGNFISTIKIPENVNVGINEFKIINELGSSQISSIKIDEQKNRLVKEGQSVEEFRITNIPETVSIDDTLSISGVGHPGSPVLISIKNQNIFETIQVVNISGDGTWNFEKPIGPDEIMGERNILIKNKFEKSNYFINLVADDIFSVSIFSTTTDSGDAFVLTGQAQPNKDLVLIIKNPDDHSILFDLLEIDESGQIQYEFLHQESFKEGTYALTAIQDNVKQISLFTLGTTSYDRIIVYGEKMNFKANSQAKINILGPPLTGLTLDIFDSSDNRKSTEIIQINANGVKTYTLDLTGYSAGVYKAVASNPTYQDTAQFSVGLISGTGPITLSSTKINYTPGESILLIGKTGPNAILTLSLVNTEGIIIHQLEIFTDKDGMYTTDLLGIPESANYGVWSIKAHSGLDQEEIEINVISNNS